jgi:acetolactate synthase-1/2/3 large subunit
MLKNGGGVSRQLGVQEVETQPLVNSIVKYYTSITTAESAAQSLNEAWEQAVSGRPGPVWIEIPLDIQTREIDRIEESILELQQPETKYKEVVKAIANSKKPLIVIGGGIHSSSAEFELVLFAKKMGIPVVSTWGANDVFASDDEAYIGNFGILGNRIPNTAVQNSDLLLILGARMSIPNTGYQTELFSPNSFKIMVNLDESEMLKSTLKVNLSIKCDLRYWLSNFPHSESDDVSRHLGWKKTLKSLDSKFGIENEEILNQESKIDSYEVIELVSKFVAQGATVVTDMGTSFTCTMQAFKNQRESRLFTSSGTSSMGFGLPGAIGAYFADQDRPVYLIAGDGGFQMNIQELQTVKFHRIPIRIIILNSNGYLAISIMQQNSFASNFVGSTPESGIDAPDFSNIAHAYGIASSKIKSSKDLKTFLEDIKVVVEPVLLEICIPNNQMMRPRSQSLRREDGTFYSEGIDVMWPFLSDTDFSYIKTLMS